MLRLLALCVPVAIVMVGFGMPFFISGSWGFALAAILIVLGSAALWFVEKKTIHRLDKESTLNNILNTNDGPD